MNSITARPQLLKQVNLSLIRKVIKAKGTATKAEIARETKISSTTVRSLLAEMMQDGEIESIGYDESSGGRKAERYGFQMEKYFSAAFCITNNQIHGLLINVYGKILETTSLDAGDEEFELAIISYLDQLILHKEIKSVGIGVPGIVEGGCYWRTDKRTGELCKSDIGERIAQRYKVPVILENDLNAITIGIGRCYEKEISGGDSDNTNLVYLHFEEGCVSAGLITGGRIIRGCHNFAGELGLIPFEGGRLLHECISDAKDEVAYANLLIQIICWICGILNPQYVVLGGPDIRKECIAPICDSLFPLLPKHMLAEICYSPDVWHDYHDGMAYLAASKMFDDIQFIKE